MKSWRPTVPSYMASSMNPHLLTRSFCNHSTGAHMVTVRGPHSHGLGPLWSWTETHMVTIKGPQVTDRSPHGHGQWPSLSWTGALLIVDRGPHGH